MRSFTAVLTAAVLAVHAALGCCWHHGHGHSSPAAGLPATGLPATGLPGSGHACSHGHQHGGGQGEAPDEKPHGGPCEEDACVFLAGEKPVAPENSPGALPALLDLSSGALHLPAAIRTRYVPQALPPPLRLHLAKRVLLI